MSSTYSCVAESLRGLMPSPWAVQVLSGDRSVLGPPVRLGGLSPAGGGAWDDQAPDRRPDWIKFLSGKFDAERGSFHAKRTAHGGRHVAGGSAHDGASVLGLPAG